MSEVVYALPDRGNALKIRKCIVLICICAISLGECIVLIYKSVVEKIISIAEVNKSVVLLNICAVLPSFGILTSLLNFIWIFGFDSHTRGLFWVC